MRKFLLRLGLPAILALLFAFTARGPAFTTCYAVCSEDSNYYYVCGSTTGKTIGIDYECNDHPTKVCVVCSSDTPDVLRRIRKVNSVVFLYGEYVDLSQLK